MKELITSAQNSLIKLAASLKQKKYRDETGLFVVEGIRLVEELAHSDWQAQTCIYTAEAAQYERVQNSIAALTEKKCRMVVVPNAIYDKVTDTKEPQGIMVLAEKRTWEFVKDLSSLRKPLLIVLDGIQDPGNVGAAIRTADAAGCTGVLLTKGCADLFSGKTVRASMGSLFHIPIFEGLTQTEIITALRSNKIVLLATSLDSSEVYFGVDFTKPTAIVFGNEGQGVSAEMLADADCRLYIPILGSAESLNVAASAAVILYEAVRQRQ